MSAVDGDSADKIIASSNSNNYLALSIRDTGLATLTTQAQVKEYLRGTFVVYEAKNPQTESGTPFEEEQVCDDYGTEEFEAQNIAPMQHETIYKPNLQNFIDRLYNYTGGDPTKLRLATMLTSPSPNPSGDEESDPNVADISIERRGVK